MLQCIFLVSDAGEVMLEKQLTGHRVDRSICAWFWEQAISLGDSFKQQPVIASPTHYIFQVFRDGITFLGCTQVEMPPLMAIEFLCRVANVLNDYFGALNEDIIKDNFVIVYELLDEMIDNGFPLTTEPSILREMITPPNMVDKALSIVTGSSSNVSDTLPGAAASCVPWRTAEPKYSNNEVYVDLVEEMDAIINRDGGLVKCEIYGEVQVNSRISGFPDLTLSFTNPSILNDVRFHPCVRFRPWESHQILSFVPPDGQFKLMSYRVRKLKSTPIYVKPQLTSDGGICRVSVLAGIRNDPGKTIDSVTVQFQLPPFILSADLTSNHGTVNILAKQTCIWSIGRIPKDKTPSLSGTLVIETGLERLHVFPTFQVGFRIMGVALSGLQIDKLDLKTVPYRFYKGFPHHQNFPFTLHKKEILNDLSVVANMSSKGKEVAEGSSTTRPSHGGDDDHHHNQQQQLPLSRYESQKRRDWNTFGQYLRNQRPPVALSQCSSNHVLEFLRYLDQFGKTKVHSQGCLFFGQTEPPGPCTCPLRQAWGSLDALIGRLRAAYEENGGLPETNPFASGAIRVYLREVRDSQSKARGIPYKKKKKKRNVIKPNGDTSSSNLPMQ